MGLIQVCLADRVGDNLVALVTKSNSVYALVAAILALTLAGCATSVDVQSDPAAALTVSGQLGAANLLASGESAPVPNARDTLAPTYEMPFVRSQPKAVAPFPLVLNRTVQQY